MELLHSNPSNTGMAKNPPVSPIRKNPTDNKQDESFSTKLQDKFQWLLSFSGGWDFLGQQVGVL